MYIICVFCRHAQKQSSVKTFLFSTYDLYWCCRWPETVKFVSKQTFFFLYNDSELQDYNTSFPTYLPADREPAPDSVPPLWCPLSPGLAAPVICPTLYSAFAHLWSVCWMTFQLPSRPMSVRWTVQMRTVAYWQHSLNGFHQTGKSSPCKSKMKYLYGRKKKIFIWCDIAFWDFTRKWKQQKAKSQKKIFWEKIRFFFIHIGF